MQNYRFSGDWETRVLQNLKTKSGWINEYIFSSMEKPRQKKSLSSGFCDGRLVFVSLQSHRKRCFLLELRIHQAFSERHYSSEEVHISRTQFPLVPDVSIDNCP